MSTRNSYYIVLLDAEGRRIAKTVYYSYLQYKEQCRYFLRKHYYQYDCKFNNNSIVSTFKPL